MGNGGNKVGMLHLVIAGVFDGLQVLAGFLVFIPAVGIVLEVIISFLLSLAAFLTFGIFFNLWLWGVLTGEVIPGIDKLPIWTGRMLWIMGQQRISAALSPAGKTANAPVEGL